MAESEGEKRLRQGFKAVLDNLKEVLSTEAFESALAPVASSKSEAIRQSFVSTFTENCQAQFEALLTKHDVRARLRDLDEEIRTPLIHKKRHLKPLNAGDVTPLRWIQALEAEQSAKRREALERQIQALSQELDAEKRELESTRKRAKLALEGAKKLDEKFSVLLREEADTEDED